MIFVKFMLFLFGSDVMLMVFFGCFGICLFIGSLDCLFFFDDDDVDDDEFFDLLFFLEFVYFCL